MQKLAFVFWGMAVLSFVDAQALDHVKSTIDQAYTLLAQKRRSEALDLLWKAQNQVLENKKSTSKEFSAAVEKIATTFLSDRAQQLFELGISLKPTDPSMALSKMQEAAKLEADNASIQIEVLRLEAQAGDCSSALSKLEKLSPLLLQLEPLSLLVAQTQVCSGNYKSLENLRPSETKKAKTASFWDVVETERLFKTGRYQEALKLSTAASTLDPEIFYWRAQIEAQLKLSPEESDRKYVAACTKLSERQTRELAFEFRLCRHITEVETFLKKSHTASP